MELILTVAGIHLLACLSPGPDIFLVVLNSLRHGWRTGLATTAGILSGVCLHITLGIAGISYLVTQHPALRNLVALAGGAWLIRLGIGGLWHLLRTPAGKPAGDDPLPAATLAAAWRQGFLVNLLNPKALLFFLSLFSVLLGPQVPLGVRLVCGATMLAVQAAAFGSVALLMDRPQFRQRWSRLQAWLDHAISLVLFLLGAWIWITFLISLAA